MSDIEYTQKAVCLLCNKKLNIVIKANGSEDMAFQNYLFELGNSFFKKLVSKHREECKKPKRVKPKRVGGKNER